MRHRSTRTLVAVLAALLVLVSSQVASAHVTVQPPTAAQGSYAKLTFRVPNERPDAATVAVKVQLPPDHPFASVSVRPLPGWDSTVETSTLATPVEREGRAPLTEAASTITWTGGRIEPGEFQEFEVSVGPLPTDVARLTFPAIQTYSSGEEVAWIQIPVEGQPEPDRPAPTLSLTPADPSSAGDGHGTTDSTVAEVSDGSDDGTDAVAVAALVVGVIALALAAAGLVVAARGRRPTTPSGV